LGSSASPRPTDILSACADFARGLNDTGYVEGQNVAIEYRWAENQIDRLPTLAAELVRRPVAGVTLMAVEFNGKRLELLREIVPELRRVTILGNPEHSRRAARARLLRRDGATAGPYNRVSPNADTR
jgi:hypothetical protein